MRGPYQRKYGEEATIPFDLFEVDGVDFRIDAVHASGDIKVMKDEGSEVTSDNGFTDEGQGYSIVLTATEMEAARVVLYVVDQTATKAWLDTSIIIETYGHASAQHALDLGTIIADQVWNAILTGAVYNIATSSGKRLRQVSDGLGILHEGTAQAGGNNTITLAAEASATDDLYHDAYISIFGGTGVGQIRPIIAYDGTTKIVTVSKSWATNPASGSEYIIAGSSSSDLHTIQDSESAAGNLKSACAAYSATRGLAGTAVPDAAADAAGGLPISAAGSLSMDTLADWIYGGRLDAILDNIITIVVGVIIDTGSSIPGLINTVDTIVDAIKAKTDGLNFTGDDVKATLDGETVDVGKWLGTAVNEDTAGYPKVTVKSGTGQGEIFLTTGLVVVNGIAWQAIRDLFTVNSGETQSSAVAGSLVKEIAERIAKRVRSGELASLPSQTVPSHEDMLAFLFEYFRNKIIQNPTHRILYAADGVTPLATWTESDVAGVFTQEAAT